MSRPPILCIVGHTNSGKTRLIVSLVRELTARGFRIGTAKHAHHADFEPDQPGKDSFEHFHAGAQATVLCGPGRIFIHERAPQEPPLEDLARRFFSGADLVLAEGFSGSAHPHIETYRAERGLSLRCPPERLLAVVTDAELDVPCRRFACDDIEGLTDFLVESFALERNLP